MDIQRQIRFAASAAALAVLVASFQPIRGQQAPAAGVEPARFHHLHLNSTNPDAAIDYYTKAFASASRTTFDGQPAIKTGNVYILFTKVNRPPVAVDPTKTGEPQSAIWHFGWNTPDSRQYVEKFKAMKLEIVPLVTAYDGGLIDISSDALPGYLTRKQIDEARAKGVQPNRKAGFSYLRGPDGAVIENAGNFPTEYFNHVHLYHVQPLCAIAWYQQHLGATVPRPAGGAPAIAPSTGDCTRPYAEVSWPAFDKNGMVREPSGSAVFGDIALPMRPWPDPKPLVSPRGQITDHIGLSVTNLDATLARLQREGVTIAEKAHSWAGTRAAMIEGPDKLAIELVEAK